MNNIGAMPPEQPLALLLRDTERQLAEAGVDNPLLDSKILVSHALGLDRVDLLMQAERLLSADETIRVQALITRRCRREPVARILGEREFWGLPFGLNEATLEPRPDSETLIDKALPELHGRSGLSLLDLGTGTGCLLLALLHELPGAVGIGIDAAPRAIEQALANARRLHLDDRAIFRVGNWLDNVDGLFDLIISNPPYIPRQDMVTLMPEVREHDPALALDGGEDGLQVYREIIPRLPKFLKPNGFVVFEVGQGQAADVARLFQQSGFYGVRIHEDFGGVERCIRASLAA
ncbi:MAG: peptide chain release factor N(5)-glutamine methyltransferase [Alphaproteobacteria bacterium]|nr:peptide chain release factor N(5)-glutamine methyltransferase [Alphaproteobacteria bacterium]